MQEVIPAVACGIMTNAIAGLIFSAQGFNTLNTMAYKQCTSCGAAALASSSFQVLCCYQQTFKHGEIGQQSFTTCQPLLGQQGQSKPQNSSERSTDTLLNQQHHPETDSPQLILVLFESHKENEKFYRYKMQVR